MNTTGDLEAVRLESDGRVIRVTLAIFLATTLWFIRSDFAQQTLDSNLLTPRLAVRALFLGIMAWGAWQIPRSPTRDTYERRVLIITVGIALCILAINSLRPQGSSLPLRTHAMWLFAFYACFPNRPWRQFIAPFLLSVGVIFLYRYWVTSIDLAGDVVVLCTINALGIMLVYGRESRVHSEREAWARESEARLAAEHALTELKTLRGIIPICSHCRQVRSELGSWQQLEAYVLANSSADFSHGICPDCMEKHYGWVNQVQPHGTSEQP
ncbi:MAG: hypothetical protein ACT4P7_04760 [Gemmatimonadaceae bacterium]